MAGATPSADFPGFGRTRIRDPERPVGNHTRYVTERLEPAVYVSLLASRKIESQLFAFRSGAQTPSNRAFEQRGRFRTAAANPAVNSERSRLR